MRVLVVDDDRRTMKYLAELMKEQGYDVINAVDGMDAITTLKSGGETVDVVIAKDVLPVMSGTDVVRSMRKQGVNTPVMIITVKKDNAAIVEALDAGADDVVVDPYDDDILLARTRAITRRQHALIIDELSFYDMRLNTATFTVSCGEESRALGRKEFEVLKLLMTNPGQAVSKADMISHIWGGRDYAEANNIEVYISFLRKKMRAIGTRVQIRTYRKVGYRLFYTEDGSKKMHSGDWKRLEATE